jgi:hypothetical protein
MLLGWNLDRIGSGHCMLLGWNLEWLGHCVFLGWNLDRSGSGHSCYYDGTWIGVARDTES